LAKRQMNRRDAGNLDVIGAKECVAVRCSALQCVAVRCSVLQCVAMCETQDTGNRDMVGTKELLQCVAVCCSVLQHVAVCESH